MNILNTMYYIQNPILFQTLPKRRKKSGTHTRSIVVPHGTFKTRSSIFYFFGLGVRDLLLAQLFQVRVGKS